MAPVARLPLGSSVSHHAHFPAFIGRTVGVDPGSWVKQFNSIHVFNSVQYAYFPTHILLAMVHPNYNNSGYRVSMLINIKTSNQCG